MAGSTTTTRTTSGSRALSADLSVAPFPFEDLVQAYYDCRRNKRNSASARLFEKDMEINLLDLHDDLIAGTYRPGRSICFVVTRPKAREVWAATFRDRVVHHLLYSHIGPRIERSFIADSCACIKGRGTLYAATRLESKIRSASENWSKPIFYLKLDLANFFVSINKQVLRQQLAARISEPWWRDLAEQVLMHDPREDYDVRSPAHLFNRVPQHKRLTAQPAHLGLPIGNLSSQFFANVYLDALDQFAKHTTPGWNQRMKAALSASAELRCDRCEGTGKYPILGACPKCGNCGSSTGQSCNDKGCGYLEAGNGAPVERDERAEFERWHAGKWPSGAPYQGRWEAWQARAALDKATEGASHE